MRCRHMAAPLLLIRDAMPRSVAATAAYYALRHARHDFDAYAPAYARLATLIADAIRRACCRYLLSPAILYGFDFLPLRHTLRCRYADAC